MTARVVDPAETRAYCDRVRARVTEAIGTIPLRRFAPTVGMSESMLRRRLDGRTDFNVIDLSLIADQLDVDLLDLVTDKPPSR